MVYFCFFIRIYRDFRKYDWVLMVCLVNEIYVDDVVIWIENKISELFGLLDIDIG